MAFPDTTVPFLGQHFAGIKEPIKDRVTATCIQIAQQRCKMLADAEAYDGFIKNEKGHIQHLDPVHYKGDIAEITRLLDTIRHSNVIYNQGSALSRLFARQLKMQPETMDMRAHWASLSGQEKIKALTRLSAFMIDTLNNSEPWLCLNYPTLALATFPATEPPIAMQVQRQPIPHTYQINDGLPVMLTLISVNRTCHSLENFDETVAMLWHEHMHMYMSALREGLKKGFLKKNHPLYKDVQNSDTITEYKITGNIYLSEEMYRAEPEEKFCYAMQDVFKAVFSYLPGQVPQPAHKVNIRP